MLDAMLPTNIFHICLLLFLIFINQTFIISI
nr:MAG TPA: hypothetical protein [Caudoviricetes sp.]